MTKEDFNQIESSQKQHDQHLEHAGQMDIIHLNYTLTVISSLKPIIKKDGDQWCVLLGENLQEGIAGFGDTPYKAILEFNKFFGV